MIVLVYLIVLLREVLVSTIFCMVHRYIAIHSFLHLYKDGSQAHNYNMRIPLSSLGPLLLGRIPLSSPPQTQPTVQKNRVQLQGQVKYKVYCLCRQPESGKMIQCDVCGELFNSECVFVPKAIWKRGNGLWQCHKCVK